MQMQTVWQYHVDSPYDKQYYFLKVQFSCSKQALMANIQEHLKAAFYVSCEVQMTGIAHYFP